MFQLICLFPNLLPSNSNFHRAIPPLHDFADISQVVRGDAAKLAECKKVLTEFLEDVRTTDMTMGMKEVHLMLTMTGRESHAP